MLKRHAIQVLRQAGHSLPEVAKLAGVSVRSVQRVEVEAPVTSLDSAAERERRGVGRPSKAAPYRSFVVEQLSGEPELISLEILRRARLAGYKGGKSALYRLIASLRGPSAQPVVRFEGLPGEFSQHDFGQVLVRLLDGKSRRIHFFASRLKYSRFVQVTIVPDETVESIARPLVEHFEAMGGVPLLAVFDRLPLAAEAARVAGVVDAIDPASVRLLATRVEGPAAYLARTVDGRDVCLVLLLPAGSPRSDCTVDGRLPVDGLSILYGAQGYGLAAARVAPTGTVTLGLIVDY